MNKYGNAPEKIIGTIENVVYRNEANDYTVLEIGTADNELITAVGIIPMAFEGEQVELCGHYTYHKEFGKQFAFDSFEKKLPEGVDGIYRYLSSRTVKGVGPVTALKIINKFGEDSFDVIENHPEWLVDIPGITMKKASAISESFREQTGIRGVMMFCKDYMGAGEVAKVYKHLGVGAVELIKNNPYILCEHEFGISFEKADNIAHSLGASPDSENRILSGIKYILSYNASVNGHTCLPIKKAIMAVSHLLELPAETVEAAINRFLDNADISSYEKNSEISLMTNDMAEAEDTVARRLYAISEEVGALSVVDISSLIHKVESDLDITFAPLQREALFAALKNGVMILTGGPGTGKTTVIKAMLSIFGSLGLKAVLAAPTGRAAKRMSEATGEEAKTVHRMLEMERTTDSTVRFCRNARNPLSENVIIVDEASMLDLSLMAALVSAVKRSARLILIGDSDQLPSVGAGNVLADLIATERIRIVRLTEIFRQSSESLIITNAHRINDGQPLILGRTDADLFFVRRDNESEIASTIADLIAQRLPRTYGASIRADIQVITPSKKGAGGVETLNAVLQERLNPKTTLKREKSSHGTVFREGDRVMQIANNYEIEWERFGATGVGLFNGDIGVIEKINFDKENMLIRFDDRIAEYAFELLDELELAYAITVHKSQGSEYPVVIIPMYYGPPMLMTRNLLYTAVTRAKNMVIMVGRPEIPSKMVNNNPELLRYTTLRDKICDYY